MKSPTAWSLSDLKQHIRAHRPDAKPLLNVIESLGRAELIFNYHFYAARDALKIFVGDGEVDHINVIKALLGEADRIETNLAYIRSEAHLTACIHTVRGSLDIFSNLINALLLEERIPLHVCDIYKAHQALGESPLKAQLGALLGSSWFTYMSGLINVTKHRQLVRHEVAVSMEENRSGVRIGSFEYKGKAFPAYWGIEVLTGVLEVKNTFVACGRTLNAECIA